MNTNERLAQIIKDVTGQATPTNWGAEDLSAVFEANKTEFNDLLVALVDRIGLDKVANNHGYENVLSGFKKGTLPTGSSIQEYFVEVADRMEYDIEKAETEVFKKVLPKVLAKIYTQKSKGMYKTTTSTPNFKQACVSEFGLDQLLSEIVNSLTVGKISDEYEAMKSILVNAYKGAYVKPIVIDAITDQASAQKAVVQLKAFGNKMKFLSREYNYMGVKTFTPLDKQVIVMTPEIKALIDVNVLAVAFNMDKTDLDQRIKVIDTFGTGLENVQVMLCDEKLVQFYDMLLQMESEYNKQGLYFNHYLHDWFLYGVSPFAQAIALVTEPTVTGVTVEGSASVAKGSVTEYTATVAGDASNYVNWSLKGTYKAGTVITKNGYLAVDPTETATKVTVVATSETDKTKKAEKEVTLTA